MITNRIIEILIQILAFVVLPIQLVTTFILGLIVQLTFGLFLIPISAIWIIFFFAPLIGLSYIYEKVYLLRILVSIIGIPIAIAGHVFSALMPSMGEKESRVSKLLLCLSFPYTWHLYYFIKADAYIKYSKGFIYLYEFFDRTLKRDSLTIDYIITLKARYNVSRMND